MKKFLIIFGLLALILPGLVFAQVDGGNQPQGENFEARILSIDEERTITRGDNTTDIQQNITLKGLSGTWKDNEFVYTGIAEIDVLNQNVYKTGDKVVVNWTVDSTGNNQFYIIQYVRHGYLYLLAIIFAIVIILVGRGKGWRSLISLFLTFAVIIKIIIPLIMSGYNPLLVSIFGSTLIMLCIIYITEGINKKTHIAMVSIFISLLLTFFISWIFVCLTKLTGFSSEETIFLVGNGSGVVDFQGLLLAGILIGTLGVLDDVILGQIETISEIKRLKPDLSHVEIMKSGNKIGRTHLSSMVNTLFLTYAGASLPILILFSMNSTLGIGFAQVLDNEVIATEIVRTLSGSIGLALAFPITTFLATYFIKVKK